MTLKKYLKSIHIERIRRINATQKIDKEAFAEWNLVSKKIANDKKKKIKDAFNFAKNLNYQHINSNLYFSHPLRVANMAISYKTPIDTELVILALNHNILEVSKLSKKKIVNIFGDNFYKNISVLNINRKLQWDRNYKKKYYKTLNKQSYCVKIIKILDKLDNLFIIGLNPSKKIRIKYIKEIENFILPMVKKNIPEIYLYFKKLVKNSYEVEHYKVNNKKNINVRNI